MIKIVKGSRSITIPNGAYPAYASAGWVKAGDTLEESKKTKTSKKPKEEESKVTEIEPEPVEEEDVEYIDPKDLMEKPIEDLDYEELRLLAEYLGIDIKGMNTSKAVRAAIKKHNNKK